MATHRLVTAGLLQAMRSTDYASQHVTMAGCDWWIFDP